MSRKERQRTKATPMTEDLRASNVNIEHNEISGNAKVHIGDYVQVRGNPITAKFCAVIVGLNRFANATYDHVQSALRHVWTRLITSIDSGWDMLQSRTASELVCVISRGSVCYSATRVGFAGYFSKAESVGWKGDLGFYALILNSVLAILCNLLALPPLFKFQRSKLVILTTWLLLLKALDVESVITYIAVSTSSISILQFLYNHLDVSTFVTTSPIVGALATGSEREDRPTPESGMKQSRWMNHVSMALFAMFLPYFILVVVFS